MPKALPLGSQQFRAAQHRCRPGRPSPAEAGQLCIARWHRHLGRWWVAASVLSAPSLLCKIEARVDFLGILHVLTATGVKGGSNPPLCLKVLASTETLSSLFASFSPRCHTRSRRTRSRATLAASCRCVGEEGLCCASMPDASWEPGPSVRFPQWCSSLGSRRGTAPCTRLRPAVGRRHPSGIDPRARCTGIYPHRPSPAPVDDQGTEGAGPNMLQTCFDGARDETRDATALDGCRAVQATRSASPLVGRGGLASRPAECRCAAVARTQLAVFEASLIAVNRSSGPGQIIIFAPR